MSSSSTPAASTPAALRKLLNEILRTPADLDAFCVDHFPSVYRGFALGMDRTERVSLLLMNGDADEILARLRSDYAGTFEQHKHLLPVEEHRGVPAKAPSLPQVTVPRPMLPRIHREPTERSTLTVLFDKNSVGQLAVRYSLADDDQAVQVGPMDWESLWSKTTLTGKKGLPALRYALTTAKEPELWAWLASVVDTLFPILFPVR